jgi:hypothetical protein
MEDQMANQLVNNPAEYAASLKENNDEYLETLSDSELIELANDEGMEEMIVRDGEGGLANRKEIISSLKYTDGLKEADEEVAVDDTEVAVDGEENIDVDTTVKVDPNVKSVQDALTQAQAAAQKLGDSKLTDQIGNTITFFTRSHVVDQGAVAEELNESMFPMLKRILK